MLTLPAWQNNLTVNFFSTKYTKHYAGCPSLPNHMKVQIRSMDELLCYTEDNDNILQFENDLWDDDDELTITHGSHESDEVRLEDVVTTPVLDSADTQKNNEETSCSGNSPEKVLPASSNDYCSVVCSMTEEESGDSSVLTLAADKDGPRSEISCSGVEPSIGLVREGRGPFFHHLSPDNRLDPVPDFCVAVNVFL